ncbi:hypothetical protein BDR03DRAFT_962338 [Suillus americanus]|nr:hypothetical protein BDR03DRAFT_962338 [Suillus americanus]
MPLHCYYCLQSSLLSAPTLCALPMLAVFYTLMATCYNWSLITYIFLDTSVDPSTHSTLTTCLASPTDPCLTYGRHLR